MTQDESLWEKIKKWFIQPPPKKGIWIFRSPQDKEAFFVPEEDIGKRGN